MSRKPLLALAVFVLTFVPVVSIAGSYALGLHTAHVQQQDQARTERAQQVQGKQLERALCADLTTMARLIPPAGSPASNPARAYEQAEHRTWAGLARGLGCQEGKS